ncbi:MAG TPA: DHH family phosphoesterase, partial [Herpetosiphonaceae bacterium]
MEIILGHPVTDFDALAAQQAAARLYAGAIPVLARQLNENVAEFVGLYRDELLFADADALPDEPVARVILVDTRRIWGHWRLAAETPVVVIDHHAGPETPAPHPATLLIEPCGATTTILASRLLDAGAPISPAEATLFLLGIYEDTGNLTFAGTTAADVRCAAGLLERGADLGAVRRYGQRALSTEQEAAYRALLPAL